MLSRSNCGTPMLLVAGCIAVRLMFIVKVVLRIIFRNWPDRHCQAINRSASAAPRRRYQAMTKPVFSKPFTQQEAIPEAGIARAVEIMKTGRLHRYNLLPDEAGEAAALEMEYAKWQGADYCIACTSGGYAIQLGLRVCGVKPGDKVLANA